MLIGQPFDMVPKLFHTHPDHHTVEDVIFATDNGHQSQAKILVCKTLPTRRLTTLMRIHGKCSKVAHPMNQQYSMNTT